MRIRTAAVAALAPVIVATAAHARVEISDTRTAGVATSTVDDGDPADLTLTEDGAFALSAGTAITVDSDNDLIVESGSDITMEDADDGAAGVLIEAGHAGDISVGGVIAIDDGVDAEDEDEDGDLDGPFATGSVRFGVRLTGDGAWTGDIAIENTASLYVEGEDSVGVSIESELQGALTVLGSVAAVGDRSVGVNVQGDVSGDVVISGGSISAGGGDATAVQIAGDVGGMLRVQSSLISGGYRYTSQPTSLADLDEDTLAEVEDSDLYLEDLDAEDILQAGSALKVTGSVAGGILLGTAPAYASTDGEDGDDDGDEILNGDEDDDSDGLINSEDDDRDGDGVPDADEATASLTTYGAAPALAIGAETGDVLIGLLNATEGDGFGLTNQGTITAAGIYDGVSATGVLIGGGPGVTRIEGGISNSGAVTASAAEASATAFHLGSGAETPLLDNSGTLYAVVYTEAADTITGLQIDADASLPTLINRAYVTAAVYGEAADAVAVRDDSGTLSTFTNTGAIQAAIVATDNDDDGYTDDETVTGHAIALDFSANTTGVSIVQYGVSDMTTVDTDGDEIMDSEDDDIDGDGILNAEDDDDGDADNDGVYDTYEPYMIGEIRLGSGDDSLLIQNGYVLGDISFGDGVDVMSVTGGAGYQGAITDSDGRLSITVADGGIMDARQAAATDVTELTVGDGGELIVAIDSATGTSGGFNVSGQATFESGAILGVHLDSLVGADVERYTLVTANSLSFGDLDEEGLTLSTPYMTVAAFAADQDAGTVYVDIRQRTTSEMGMIGVEAAQYSAFYDALSRDDNVKSVFLGAATRDTFINLYEQTLPDHSGGSLTALSDGVDVVNRALSQRNDSLAPGERSGWVQELNFYADKDKTDTYGYRSEALAIAGGVEQGTRLGVVGVSAALSTADIHDPESEAEEVLSATLLELGLYWRAQDHGWTTWARAAVGYAMFDSSRALVSDDIYLTNEASWTGYTLAGAAGVSYSHDFGRLTLTPTAYVDWFSLYEGSRTENGGGDAFDLQIDDRTGHLARGTAALNIGYAFGRDRAMRPELTLGWRQMLSADYGDTIARYVSGGSDFVLGGQAVEGGGPLVGLGFTIGNSLGAVTVSGDAQMLEDYVRYSLLLRASFRF